MFVLSLEWRRPAGCTSKFVEPSLTLSVGAFAPSTERHFRGLNRPDRGVSA